MIKKIKKQELVVVATQYKTKPIKIGYYTREGKSIPKSSVKKEYSKYGIRFFSFA